MDDKKGKIVHGKKGRYRIVGTPDVVKGGMGVVFFAETVSKPNTEVVIKFVNLKEHADENYDRLTREAGFLQDMQKNEEFDQKNIVGIVDVSVDQGGCIETTRPTTHQNPTFVEENITHYCVTNMPGSVPFTSTTALCNATFQYIKQLASNGTDSFKNDPVLLKGLNTYKGNITHPAVAESFNLNYTDPLTLL